MLILFALLLFVAGCGSRTEDAVRDPNYIEVNDIRIHFGRTGSSSGKPVLILVHGVTDSGSCWLSLARGLEDTYDVVYYDVRGHGFSEKPSTGYLLEDHVKDLRALIVALDLEQPILMGHSMGGGIVAQIAAEYPGLPRAVILEDPAFFPQPENFSDVMRVFRAFLLSFQRRTKEQLLERVATENPNWPDGERDSWAESKLQVTPRIVETIRDLPNVAELLPRIQAPILLLKADAPAEERQQHIEAASGIRSGKLIHIDGAGHSIHRDKPAETLAAVREFLAESI